MNFSRRRLWFSGCHFIQRFSWCLEETQENYKPRRKINNVRGAGRHDRKLAFFHKRMNSTAPQICLIKLTVDATADGDLVCEIDAREYLYFLCYDTQMLEVLDRRVFYNLFPLICLFVCLLYSCKPHQKLIQSFNQTSQ